MHRLGSDGREDEFQIESLDVMEPMLYVHDALQVIYINEAFEAALEEKDPQRSAEYDEAKKSHPDYATRLRHMPMTVAFMKRYAALRKDSYMLELIARKEAVLAGDPGTYEVSLMYAFKNMFLAKYPECKNVYKATRRMDEYESRRGSAE